MSRRPVRVTLYAGLLLAFLLRHDLWLWNDAGRLWGLPVGLAYHVAFCLVVALWMAGLARLAWPSGPRP